MLTEAVRLAKLPSAVDHLVSPMTTWYAVRHSSGELLSLKGAVIVHDNPREIEWLIAPAKPIPLKGTTPPEVAHHLSRRVLLLKDHPDFSNVTWPLDKSKFW